MSIQDVFRKNLYNEPEEVLSEGKKPKKPKEVTSINKETGVTSGQNPIGKYGKTHIKSKKDKERDRRRKKGKQDSKKAMRDYNESIAIDEDISEDFINELAEVQSDFPLEMSEEMVKMLSEAFMSGFLASSGESNGENCKAVYKNSALKPYGEVWNKTLKEKFRRFVYNEKRKMGKK